MLLSLNQKVNKPRSSCLTNTNVGRAAMKETCFKRLTIFCLLDLAKIKKKTILYNNTNRI